MDIMEDNAMDTSDDVFTENTSDHEEDLDDDHIKDREDENSKDGVDYRRSNSGGNSGKFTLRSSRLARLADPQHFIQRIRSAEHNMDIDPELEELITVLKTTDALDDIMDEKDRSIFKSFITSTLVKQFEQATETGELPSPTGHSPGPTNDGDDHEPMSLKEELADQEEEKGQSPLNLDANKQKVQLRQRGSLAKRRKPTRSSIRTTSTSEATNGEPHTKAVPINVHHGSVDVSDDSSDDSEAERETNIDMSVATQSGTTSSTGKTIHGVKTAIIRPEIVESGRQRLRSVPSVGPSEPRPLSSEGVRPSTPPWLQEARLKKSSRPPKGETEKLRHETEPETPSWMKDVLAKKKKAAERVQSQSSTDDPASPRSSLTKESAPTSPPWLQETVQRKSNRPKPTSKDVANSVNNLIADSAKSETEQMEIDSPRDQRGVKGQLTNGISATQIENNSSTTVVVLSKTTVMSPTSREPPTKKSPPPLQPHMTSSFEDAPSWRTEVALRRKNKAYIVSQRPEQPLKLGEIPQWKKDLLEKNKQRRVSDGAELIETKPVTTETIPPTPRSAEIRPHSDVPPWKVEIDEKRKRQSLSTRMVFDESPKEKMEKKAPEEEPEWAHLVAIRRKKLASSGLLSQDSGEDVS